MTQSLVAFSLVGLAVGQQTGHQKVEYHPSMDLQVCAADGSCLPEHTKIVMDANWRWLHNVDGYLNCYDGAWNATFCPDSDSCCNNCALDGVEQNDWSEIYGVNATDGGFHLSLKQGDNVGSRFYLLDSKSPNTYRMFHLLNREFTFDADVSTLGCGLNGALYFVEMDADGGEAKSRQGLNKAGAAMGTGYCDAQCANDIKFIGGVANINETNPYGSCCAEMDIWEANSLASAFTAHPCNIDEGLLRCEGDDCNNICDKGGCDFNAYRNGNKDQYGAGSQYNLDTSKPFTVVTQFLTSDGTDSGTLSEIRRFYIQDGKEIPEATTKIDGLDAYDSLTDDNCKAQKSAFGEENDFSSHGGMAGMGAAMSRGMVLVMSIWDDAAANMLWLDSVYPEGATGAGAERGPCATDSGVPADVEETQAHSYAGFTNLRFGPIGSTTGSTPAPTPPAPSPVPTDCPGGSRVNCINLCPSDVFAACAESCKQRCPEEILV